MTKTKIIIGEILNEKNIKSNIWSAITNFFIVLLIVLNAVQIILEVDPDYSEYNTLFRIIDSVSIGVFSIEYILRFWTSSSIDIRYKGFVGKLRYLFSSYRLISNSALLYINTTFWSFTFRIQNSKSNPYSALGEIHEVFRYYC